MPILDLYDSRVANGNSETKKKQKIKLDPERKQWGIEIKAMQAKTESANSRDQTLLKKQEIKNRIEEVEGSCHGTTFCPRLMSLSIDEDKYCGTKFFFEKNH